MTSLDIKTAPAPMPPIPDKAILWAAQDNSGNLPCGDYNRFPDIGAIKTRFHAQQPSPLNSFGEAVSNAQQRVWIIDHYFFDPDKDKGSRRDRVELVKNWFVQDTMRANDIRILTGKLEDKGGKDIDTAEVESQFYKCADFLSKRRLRGEGRCNIEVLFALSKTFGYVHDRFAIIDNELWHFGATVGGFHAQVNAATRGWNASDHNSKEFFERAWDGEYLKGKKR